MDMEARNIEFEIRIVNASARTVVIDKNAVFYQIIFERKGKHFANGGVGSTEALVTTGDPGPNYQPASVTLRPKQVYRSIEAFSLDKPFFNEGGIFTLSLTYGFFREHQIDGLVIFRGTFSSNVVEFRYNPKKRTVARVRFFDCRAACDKWPLAVLIGRKRSHKESLHFEL